MSRLTLEQFLLQEIPTWRRNAWVSHPGFKSLYVRHSRRLLGSHRFEQTLDIGSIEATKKGKGTFKALLVWLGEKIPGRKVYVESVVNPKFAEGLRKLGFIEVERPPELESAPPSFWKEL